MRNRFLDQLADELRGRVDAHTARYARGRFGRAWVTYDGVEVVSTEVWAIDHGFKVAVGGCVFGLPGVAIGRAIGNLGELSAESALAHHHPAVRAVALLDRRVGAARLARAAKGTLHPIEAVLLMVRQHARGERHDWPCCPACNRALFQRPSPEHMGTRCYDFSCFEEHDDVAI